MKVAMITGASSGIGEATAHALAREGFAVVITARSFEKLEQIKNDLIESGHHALAVKDEEGSSSGFGYLREN